MEGFIDVVDKDRQAGGRELLAAQRGREHDKCLRCGRPGRPAAHRKTLFVVGAHTGVPPRRGGWGEGVKKGQKGPDLSLNKLVPYFLVAESPCADPPKKGSGGGGPKS